MRSVPTARPDEEAAATLGALRGRRFDLADAVYVVDAAGALSGVVSMADLFAAEPGVRLSDVARKVIAAPPELDRERVAALARRFALSSVPIVDGQGRFQGVVPAATLIDVLAREHYEDIHRLAGILHLENHAREAMAASPLRRAGHRLPWLLVGLAGSLVAAAVVGRFEAALRETIVLAFFVPTIVYLADAIGTQAEVEAVRGLSVARGPFWPMLRSELGAGATTGAALGVLAGAAAWLVGGPALAGVVASSVLVAGATASTVGLALPWLLARSGRDPAYGSGPLATVIQDVLSLLVYFAIAGLVL
jgi:magnesium transporter